MTQSTTTSRGWPTVQIAYGLGLLLCASSAWAQQRVISTAGQGVEVTQPAAPAGASAASMASTPAAASTPTAATELRRVRPGESLMAISREVAASRNVSLAQAMMGLYRANPEAFVGGDMSQLLVGAELRIPAREAFTATSRGAAFREVQQRLGIWGGAQESDTAAATTTTSAPAAPPPRAAAPRVAPSAATPAPAATTTLEPATTETPLADATTLQAELETQKARIAELETALQEARAELETSIPPTAMASSALEQRLGNLWWLWGVALALIAFLAILLRGQSRRAAQAEEQAEAADAALARAHRELNTSRPADPEVEVEPAASQASPPAPSANLDEVIRAEPEPPVSFNEVMSATSEDLEGDPPPIEEAGSMIDLARAYIEMGDYNAAMTELQLALKNGNEAQRAEALRLLDSLPKS